MLRWDVKFKSTTEADWKPEALSNQVLSAHGRLFSSVFQWFWKKAEDEGKAEAEDKAAASGATPPQPHSQQHTALWRSVSTDPQLQKPASQAGRAHPSRSSTLEIWL